MIVPYAAGGPTDTVGRLLSEPMTRVLGQQVVVENVGGASGTMGPRVSPGRTRTVIRSYCTLPPRLRTRSCTAS